ncbi:molecular chaperone [Glaciecola siphonariae]|uniref:Molecular chaperone n=1 Tax=Glaciecola siphonariae TaxID=521012 RepID=A0ABV9LVK6_9ALTE
MKTLLIKVLVLTIMLFIGMQSAFAALLVAPLRVAFENRERTQEVILINQSDKRHTYRLEWVERSANENGTYNELSEEDTFNRASGLIRFSPRQVSLAPGERQVIKLLLRKPADLAKGEYRSHLRFVAIPPTLDSGEDEVTDGIAMKMHMFLSYSIPVIVRNGIEDALVNIGDTTLIQEGGKYKLRTELYKDTKWSTSGNLVALQQRNSQQEVVARLNNVNIFHESNKRTAELVLMDPNTPLSGPITIKYEGIYESLGKTLAEKSIVIQ